MMEVVAVLVHMQAVVVVEQELLAVKEVLHQDLEMVVKEELELHMVSLDLT